MRPRLYKRPYSSVGPSVGPSVGKTFVKIDEKWTLRILNDLDSARQGGTRRKEERGGRRNERNKGRGE